MHARVATLVVKIIVTDVLPLLIIAPSCGGMDQAHSISDHKETILGAETTGMGWSAETIYV